MLILTEEVSLEEVLEMTNWSLDRLRRSYPGGKHKALEDRVTRGEMIFSILEAQGDEELI